MFVPQNIGVVIGPNIMAKEHQDALASASIMPAAVALTAFLVQHSADLFSAEALAAAERAAISPQSARVATSSNNNSSSNSNNSSSNMPVGTSGDTLTASGGRASSAPVSMTDFPSLRRSPVPGRVVASDSPPAK